MAGRITLWGAQELLMSFFSQTSVPPGDFYLALIKDGVPNAFVSGAELDEPDAASYSRVAIPNDQLNWTNNGQMHVVSTELDATYTVATEDWGIVRYWALCNSPVDGYVYATGNLELPLDPKSGDTVVVSAGDLSVVLGPFFTTEEN